MGSQEAVVLLESEDPRVHQDRVVHKDLLDREEPPDPEENRSVPTITISFTLSRVFHFL